jgi:hypothetical protein
VDDNLHDWRSRPLLITRQPRLNIPKINKIKYNKIFDALCMRKKASTMRVRSPSRQLSRHRWRLGRCIWSPRQLYTWENVPIGKH